MTTPDRPTGRDVDEPELRAQLRQGDVIGCLALPVVVAEREIEWVDTPDGVVILSQTCDLVRPNQALVAVAPLVQLDYSTAGSARSGRRPRFVHVPERGDDWFADLQQVASVRKDFVVGLDRSHGVVSDSDISSFGRLVGRRFSRFAFPDEVAYWLQPLEQVARAKHARPQSAEGQLFGEVVQLRLELHGSWEAAPYALTLVVILAAGVLPAFPGDELPELPIDLSNALRPNGVLVPADAVAERLRAATDPVDRYWLWQAMGEAWATRCKPADIVLTRLDELSRRRVREAVLGQEIGFDVTSEDEFSLYRYRRSEMLDLDHLSPSLPFVTERVRSPAIAGAQRLGDTYEPGSEDTRVGLLSRIWRCIRPVR